MSFAEAFTASVGSACAEARDVSDKLFALKERLEALTDQMGPIAEDARRIWNTLRREKKEDAARVLGSMGGKYRAACDELCDIVGTLETVDASVANVLADLCELRDMGGMAPPARGIADHEAALNENDEKRDGACVSAPSGAQ